MQSILLILGVLGSLSLFLSGFLVVNTISAMVAQQIRQIGMMKAVGARAGQVLGVTWGWSWSTVCWPSASPCRRPPWAPWA